VSTAVGRTGKGEEKGGKEVREEGVDVGAEREERERRTVVGRRVSRVRGRSILC